MMFPKRMASPLVFAGTLLLVFLTPTVRASFISGSVVQQQLSNVDLTTQGTIDWAVWGMGTSTSLAPDVHMSGGSGISILTDITNGDPLRGLGQFDGYGESTFDWSNGTPTASAVGAYTGLQNDGEGHPNGTNVAEGFSLNVAAGPQTRVLYLYTTVNLGVGQVTARLSDGSTAPVVQTLTATGLYNGAFVSEFVYAGNPSTTLDVTLVLSQNQEPLGHNNANIGIQAAALGFDSNPGSVPEPSTLILFGTGIALIALAGVKRR